MSMLNVRKFYRAKTLLITGASGFVGKVLLWSVLTNLELKRVYVILRDKRDKNGTLRMPAADRLEQEVFKCRIFQNVPEAKRKLVVAFAGDIETDGLGLSAEDHKSLAAETEIIIHAAASVRFQATLKDNLNTNTFGSLRVLELAKACTQLQALVHVSTAYVNSDLGTGLVVEEKAFPPLSNSEEMLSLLSRITSIDNPPAGTEEVLKKLQGSHFNTYTFTKQLAEDLILERRGSVKVGIVRPTIVGSAWKQPVPGWVDSALAAGALFAAGATGLITICPGRPQLIGDQIPVDFVCNCAIVMGAAVGLNLASEVVAIRRKTVPGRSAWPVEQPCKAEAQDVLITQVSSSTTNPVSWKYTIDIVQAYFQANPLTKGNCRVPRFSFVESTLLFRAIFLIGTLIPAMMNLYIVQAASLVSSRYSEAYQQAQRNVKMAYLGLNIAFAFAPFTSLEWFFDNRNTLALCKLLGNEEREIFYLDSRLIDWRKWLVGYCQGLRTEVLKEPPPPDPAYTGRGPETIETLHKIEDSKPAEIVTKSLNEIESTQKVIQMACRISPHVTSKLDEAPSTLSSSEESSAAPVTQEDVEQFLKWTQAKLNPYITVPTALIVHSVLDVLFSSILVDRESAEILSKMWQSLPALPTVCPKTAEDLNEHRNPNPVLLIPTHKSYFDFVVLTYLCLALQLRIPMVAADKVFATIPIVSVLLRASGAFFLQRGGQNTPKQSAILRTYFKEALQFYSWIQFFIEGGRSRTGYVLRPKKGLLRYAMELLADNQIETLRIVPIAMNYGDLPEVFSLGAELLGHSKVTEGFHRVIQGLRVFVSSRLRIRRPAEPLRTTGVSIKAAAPITVTVDDLSDPGSLSWRIICRLQSLRQLSPQDVIAWAVLCKENQTSTQLAAKVRDIVEYLKFSQNEDPRPKVFGVLPHRLEEQLEHHLLKEWPFRDLFEQTSHVTVDVATDETSVALEHANASLDTLPSATIEYDNDSPPRPKLTKKVWSPRWVLAVPTFNLHMNQLQFYRAGALDLVGADATFASVILTRRRSHKITTDYLITETLELSRYFQETAIAKQLVSLREDETFAIARRLLNSDTPTVSLLRSLIRPLLHGAKAVIETLRSKQEDKAGGETSCSMNDLIKQTRLLAATTPCALGAFPLIDPEIVRSILSIVQTDPDPLSRTVSLDKVSSERLYDALVFLKAYVDE